MDWTRFQTILEEKQEFPCRYTFKFIVPAHERAAIEHLFEKDEIKWNASKSGRFVSLTVFRQVDNAHEVVEVYQLAAQIKGVISL